MDYLGLKRIQPKVAFFDFTGCEGCQLQVANKEETLVDFLSLVDVVEFRIVSSDRQGPCDIAFVEGAISRQDQVARLERIRKKAGLLVALGTCACFGGVNKHANRFDAAQLVQTVYGEASVTTLPVRSVKEVVPVDFELPGCPIVKEELENVVVHLVLGAEFRFKKYPVCVECKQNLNHCLLDEGQICFGPVVRAGCHAACINSKLPCYGCRGPADAANWTSLETILQEKGFSSRQIAERAGFFNSLGEVVTI